MIVLLPAALAQAAPEDAAALVRRLNADLLAHPSATAVLQRWCAERRLADPPVMRALVDRTASNLLTPEQRARLQVGADEPVGYRRVRLVCGTHILSEAENWYVPSRLTAAMRAQLADTDTPFGAVIGPLGPTRHNLEAVQLWLDGPLPRDLFRHRALVVASDGRPLAEVVETYTAGVLEFSR